MVLVHISEYNWQKYEIQNKYNYICQGGVLSAFFYSNFLKVEWSSICPDYCLGIDPHSNLQNIILLTNRHVDLCSKQKFVYTLLYFPQSFSFNITLALGCIVITKFLIGYFGPPRYILCLRRKNWISDESLKT